MRALLSFVFNVPLRFVFVFLCVRFHLFCFVTCLALVHKGMSGWTCYFAFAFTIVYLVCDFPSLCAGGNLQMRQFCVQEVLAQHCVSTRFKHVHIAPHVELVIAPMPVEATCDMHLRKHAHLLTHMARLGSIATPVR